MALFQGEDMVDVTTPDGRTIQVPRSLSGMAPQQIAAMPQGAPSGMNIPGVAPMQPQQEIAPPTLAPPEAPQQTGGIVEEGDPDVVPITMMEPEVVSANPRRVAQARAQQAAYNASPKGQLANAQGAQQGAVEAKAEALIGEAQIQAAQDEVIHDAQASYVQDMNKRSAALEEDARANIAAQEKAASRTQQLFEKMAKTKIDRSIDNPIMMAIGAALVGIGQGIQGQKITTQEIILNAIDRKVAAQEADLDRLGKTYDMSKEEVAMLKERSKSKIEFHNTMIAAETQKHIRQLEEIVGRSASERTKATLKTAIAGLEEHKADKLMEATRWGVDFDQKDRHHKAQIGLGYANNRLGRDSLNETIRSNKEDEQFKREKAILDYNLALANDKAKGDDAAFKMRMEAKKEISQRGVKGMANDYLLTREGRKKMEEADKLEKEVAAIESNPDQMARSIASDKVALMKQKAAVLRGQAQTEDAVLALNPTVAAELGSKYASAQAMMDNIDEIKALYDKASGRSYVFNDAESQEIDTKLATLNLQIKEATGSGAWDKGLALLYKDITGGNPTSGWDVGAVGAFLNRERVKDPEGFKKRLDSIALNVGREVSGKIGKLSSWDGKEELFTRKPAANLDTPAGRAAAKIGQGHSQLERIKSAEEGIGVVGEVLERLPGTGTAMRVWGTDSEGVVESANEGGSVRYPGLDEKQAAGFETLLRQYKTGTPAEKAAAADQLVGIAASVAEKRPDLAVPILQNIEQHATPLYAAARAKIPKTKGTPDNLSADERMTMYEKGRIGVAGEPAMMLMNNVIGSIDSRGRITDEVGRAELARRAGDPTHPEHAVAKQALSNITRQVGVNKSLPPDSVFQKGKR